MNGPDITVHITGNNFAPKMTVLIVYLGYFQVTATSSGTAHFTIPASALTLGNDGTAITELQAFLLDDYSRSSDFFFFQVKY
jgi:hypothetical protein